MTNTPFRAGIIGLGVGRNHAEAYLKSPDAQLVALCDTDEKRLRELAEAYGVAAEGCFTDYNTMLAKTNLDIVSVCLPNALHKPASISALNAGAHVMCEKPMAITTAEAQAMLQAAENNQRHLMVSYNYRYRADSHWMYQMARGGHLGKIYHANVSWRRETGIPGWGLFANKAMSGGGALIDVGVHVLDLALWMLGFPKATTVSGQTRTAFGPASMKTWGRENGDPVEGGFDVDDGAVGFIRLGNDAHIVLQATWGEHNEPQEDRIRVELQGTKGTAIMNIGNYVKENTLRFYTEIENEPVVVTPRTRSKKPEGHTGLIAETLASLRAGAVPPTDGAQGLAVTQILEALYLSAERGHEVALS